MNFWSLNTRFYLTISWWETPIWKPMVSWWETPIWKTRNFCKSTRLHLTMFKTERNSNLKQLMNFWSLKDVVLPYDWKLGNFWNCDDEKKFTPIFLETTDVKAMNFWSRKHLRFYLTMQNSMVSWWETPIWNNGCKSDEMVSNLKHTDVKAMNFWSKDSFLPYDGKLDGFLMRNSNLKQRM